MTNKTIFNTRTEVISALVKEFDHNPKGFDYNASAHKFWTFNRLKNFYWDIKQGRKERYKTKLNKATGFYELKKNS